MKGLVRKLRKNLLLDTAVCVFSLYVCHPSIVFAKDTVQNLMEKEDGESYTINFQNISVIEYIKFVSKITNVNFVFEDQDLQFTVTVVSEEPITVKNIMSTLIQVLRIHGLALLEQDNNLVISRNSNVSQISTIVSSDLPEPSIKNPPLVTRVFRLKNANPNSIAAMIRPMTSASAIIEVSPETRQLIVMDVTTNVDKIAELLLSLDAPHSPLDWDTYVVKSVTPTELIALVKEIVSPFADGNSLILVPQLDTNTIYIVSTPYLIDRVLTIMQDLDVPAKSKIGNQVEEIFIYKVQYQSPESLEASLKKVATDLQKMTTPPETLIDSISNMKLIPESNSMLFTGDQQTIQRLKDILGNLDARQAESAVSKEHATLYFYKTTAEYKKKVKKFLDQMASNLMEAPIPNQDLIRCIQNVKWVEETESYLFQGNASTIATIKELITTFEIQEGLFQPGETTEESQLAGRQTFFLYELKYTTGEFIESSLKNLMKKMEDSNLTDASLMKTIENIKWIKENNSLLITGSAASIDKVKSLIAQFDVEGLQASGVSTPHQLLGKPTFLIYKAENIPGEKLMEMLRNIANDLKGTDAADRDLQNAISNMKYLAENNSVFFTGYEKTLEKIQSLAKQFDVPGKQGGISAFFLYELKNVRGDKMQEDLNKIAWRLKKSPENNTDLIRAIENIQWIKENNSLMLVGPASTLEQLKTLIAQFDTDTGVIGRVAKDKTSFFIYKPVNLTSEELEASLEIIYKDLKSSGLVDPELLQALGNIQKVQSTGSLLFTGSPEALEKIKELLANVDIRVGEGGAVSKIENVTFFIYQLQHVPATQLISSLKTVAIDLQNSNVSDKEVAASINSMKWIKETNSLLFTGSAETLKGVQALLAQFDNPNISVQKTFTEPSPQPLPVSTHGPSEFIIYKPQYVSGDVLIGILQDFKTNLMQTGVNDQGLFVTIDALRWIPKTRSLLVSGEKNSIIKVEELLRQFDVPSSANMEDTGEDNFTQATNFLVFKLQYQKGDEIQNAIKKIGTSLTSVGEASKQPLTEAINSLQWIEATNSLLASGDSESLQKIKHLIEDLDIPLNQVLIEVLVLETSLLNGQSFGLEWAARGQYKNRLTSSLSNVTSGTDAFSTGFNAVNPQVGPISSNLPLLSGFDLGVIGNTLFHKGQSFLTLASLINALQTDSDSTIIMNPKIVTQDNKSATVFVGQNIPFVGSVITSTTATQTSTTSLEYRNIGTTLTVTPVIGENDLISLEIVTEISSTVGTPQATETGQVNGIITNETTMNTRVHVPNQHFLILSGMLNDQETHSKTGIPCLGGLPIVGAAFSNNSRTATKNNVLIFVRPHIIKSYDDYKKVTEHQENLYKDQYPSKNMKESIDRGIDMLKTYIDE